MISKLKRANELRTTNEELRRRVLGKRRRQLGAGRVRREFRNWRTLVSYAVAFVAVMAFVFVGSDKNQETGGVGNMSVVGGVSQTSVVPSVDQLIEAGIVADLAEVANLPVMADVANASVSLAIRYEIAQSSESVIQKPQIVDISSLPRGLSIHKVVEGETLSGIASRYGVSTTTIRWANGLKSDGDMKIDQDLVVPSIDGVVYTVKAGDTIAGLAEKYKSDIDSITVFNDLELKSIEVGQKIILPNGDLPEKERPEYVAPRVITYNSSSYYSYANYGGSISRIISRDVVPRATSSGNRNAWGNCTWFVWEYRKIIGRPLPDAVLGNANQWHKSLAGHGYVVNHTPSIGAVMQTSAGGRGYGHVMVVVGVSEDGSVTVWEMNAAGYNVVNERTFTVEQAAHYNFIH